MTAGYCRTRNAQERWLGSCFKHSLVTKNLIWLLAQMGRRRLSSRYDFLWLRPLGLRATHSTLSLTRNISKVLVVFELDAAGSCRIIEAILKECWSILHGIKFRTTFLKVWGQVSRWKEPQIGPLFFPVLLQVSCPWHFKPWHYIRGKHWPQSWVPMGVFCYRRAKCLEHTGNLGKNMKKQNEFCKIKMWFHWLASWQGWVSSLPRWFCSEAKSGDDSTWERARDLGGNPSDRDTKSILHKHVYYS